MNLNNKLIPILEKINFGCRYKELCDEYCDFKNRLSKYDLDIIENFYKENELNVKFNKSERFFKAISIKNEIKIQFNIIPKRGFIQFVLYVEQKGETLSLAYGMWEAITRELISEESTKPIFTSEKDLLEILKISFDLYKEFEEEVFNTLAPDMESTSTE